MSAATLDLFLYTISQGKENYRKRILKKSTKRANLFGLRDNEFGQLGLGHTINQGSQPDQMGDSLPAIDLGLDRTVVFIDAGHTVACAILDNGIAKCWGYLLSWSHSFNSSIFFV